MRIDLNCDLGEGCGNDAELMRVITSANIACGYHAGDAETMRQTVELAVRHGVAIGAHPGFPDRKHFGRTEMHLHPDEIRAIVKDQIEALDAVAREFGTRLDHVKPHGALYNMSAREARVASAIAEAVREFDRELTLFGLSGSVSIREAERVGLRTASEVFADRTYQDDGSLTPRSRHGALIYDAFEAVNQVLQMLSEGTVTAMNGKTSAIKAKTVCIHGDGAKAVEFAAAIRDALEKTGVEVLAINA